MCPGSATSAPSPTTCFEREGDVDNVVFPCGYTGRGDGDTCYVYYGAADTCIALATCSVSTLLAWLRAQGRPPN